jgi:hypothetical protein
MWEMDQTRTQGHETRGSANLRKEGDRGWPKPYKDRTQKHTTTTRREVRRASRNTNMSTHTMGG